jgi:hypothetical protein
MMQTMNSEHLDNQPIDQQVLYHACFPDSIEAILDEGLKPGEDGFIHLCNKPEFAAGFIAVRDFVSFKGISTSVKEGKETVVVDRKKHNHACIVAVDVSALDKSLLETNERDASAALVGALPKELVSYTYTSPIQSSLVSYDSDVHRGDSSIPSHFAL